MSFLFMIKEFLTLRFAVESLLKIYLL